MNYLFSCLTFIAILLFNGCSSATITTTDTSLSDLDQNKSKQIAQITLFRLNNYTDTPRAGLRAANIVEGVLLSRGYHINSKLKEKTPSLKKAQDIAKIDGSKYFIYGGVSEWRYKTGIDGEPAVSLQLSLYQSSDGKLIWSSTGSDNDWGNASIGTTAQNLIEKMLD